MAAPAPTSKRKSGPSATSAPARAFGRSLDDFGTLSTAERTLLECCRAGEVATIAEARPEEKAAANCLRAAFVRFLALGGDDKAAIHENGIQLRGGWLTGVLNLNMARVDHLLSLTDCRIEGAILAQCQIKLLNLSGSLLIGGIGADRLRCEGGVFLREGFHSLGIVRLLGASIGGDLDCGGGIFENAGDLALACHGAAISGYVYLRHGFRAIGEVAFSGARIGRDLDCNWGAFENAGGFALICDGAVISGRLILAEGFAATGKVALIGTQIDGDLLCMGSAFENGEAEALACDNARIGGALYLRRVRHMGGSINLSSARAGTLCDDAEIWTTSHPAHVLDGFTYERLGGGAPTDGPTRIAWLECQRDDHLRKDFRPQPWEQLIAVLRAMGHPNEARTIAVAKQRRLRRAGKIVRGASFLHWLYGVFVGYGYRPTRLFTAIAIVWLGCAAAYWMAVNPGQFASTTPLLAPASAEPSAACLVARANARSGDPCPLPPPDYRSFAPLIYSADVLLPVVSLGYREEWRPVVVDRNGNRLIWGERLRALYWLEIALGWLFGGALVAMLGSLVKKD